MSERFSGWTRSSGQEVVISQVLLDGDTLYVFFRALSLDAPSSTGVMRLIQKPGGADLQRVYKQRVGQRIVLSDQHVHWFDGRDTITRGAYG